MSPENDFILFRASGRETPAEDFFDSLPPWGAFCALPEKILAHPARLVHNVPKPIPLYSVPEVLRCE